MAKIAEKELDLDNGSVEFKWSDGTSSVVSAADFSPDIVSHFTLHGISQKFGDTYSGVKGNLAEGQKAFQQLLEQLKAGDWRAARGEGESKPRVGELAEAIARIKGLPVEEVGKHLEAATDEERKVLRGNERVKAVIAIIRAEKAQKKLDALKEEKAEGEDALARFSQA